MRVSKLPKSPAQWEAVEFMFLPAYEKALGWQRGSRGNVSLKVGREGQDDAVGRGSS